MSAKGKMSKHERQTLSKIQGLVGDAEAAYHNDRDAARAEHVIVPLREAFALCVQLLAKYPAEVPHE